MGKRCRRRRKRRGLKLAAVLLLSLLIVPAVMSLALPANEHGKEDTEDTKEKTDQSAEAASSEDSDEPEVEIKEPELPDEETKQTDNAQDADSAANQPSGGTEQEITPVVDDSYFSDAVFLGDSRTEGFSLYSGLTTGRYLYAVGATVESVFTKPTQETAAGKVPIMDALAGMEFSKVYIMLGINELGWPRTETFHDQYAKLIDRIREIEPDAEIVLQSILPISAKQDAKGSYINNKRIGEFNAVIEQLAEEKDCTYLPVCDVVTGADGCLIPELTWDGIHLNVDGCKKWLDYLKANPV
jgi:hypothetical protein